MPRIITRTEWGFDGWNGTPYHVDERARRTEFFVHYEGGNPVLHQTGNSVPRAIHAYHKSRGWKGIGYGFVIDANGAIYEGRGFDLVGSHCPDHNASGHSVQIHLGGNERPTTAQLGSARWLYDEACRRAGRALAKRGHRDGFATECPGDHLYQWVKAGMPAPIGSGGGGTTSPTGPVTGGGTTPQQQEEDVMASLEEVAAVVEKIVREQTDRGTKNTVAGAVAGVWDTYRTADMRSPIGLLKQAAGGVDYDRLAAAIAAALPAGSPISPDDLDASLRRVLGSLDNQEDTP